ncbi:MAG: hypothetical protein JWR59_2517 [Brevundimonas sp.]|nr:hypothetical protein [Brevundimonas sp.]
MRDKMPVYFDKKRNKFIARYEKDGKRTYLGQFDTRAEAEYKVLENIAKAPEYSAFLFDKQTSENWFEKLLAVFKKKN